MSELWFLLASLITLFVLSAALVVRCITTGLFEVVSFLVMISLGLILCKQRRSAHEPFPEPLLEPLPSSGTPVTVPLIPPALPTQVC